MVILRLPKQTRCIAQFLPVVCCACPSDVSDECWSHYQTAARSLRDDVFVPRCTTAGQYSTVQVYGSQFVCVNEKGEEIEGTSVSAMLGVPGCDFLGKDSSACSSLRITLCVICYLLSTLYVVSRLVITSLRLSNCCKEGRTRVLGWHSAREIELFNYGSRTFKFYCQNVCLVCSCVMFNPLSTDHKEHFTKIKFHGQ